MYPTTVDALPTEILQHIFLNALVPNYHTTFVFDETPIRLSHVCKQWFFAATHYPPLWSQIHVILDRKKQTPDPSTDRRRYLILLFLKNSVSHPLDVVFLSLTPTTLIFPDDYYKFCMEEVMKHASRIRSLHLDTFYLPAIDVFPPHFLALERLDFVGLFMLPKNRVQQLLRSFQNTPVLNEIKFDCAPLTFPLPCKQLRKASFRGASINDLDYLFTQNAPLEHLTLDDFNLARTNSTTLHCTLPHLRSLQLFGFNKDQLEDFFDHVDLPLLDDLTITGQHADPPPQWNEIPLKKCILRSDCNIRHFTFQDFIFTETDFSATLQLMPQLESLDTGYELGSHWVPLPYPATLFRELVNYSPKLTYCSFRGTLMCNQNLGSAVDELLNARKLRLSVKQGPLCDSSCVEFHITPELHIVFEE